jgi:uncharacterized damage-inducible protein DinB
MGEAKRRGSYEERKSMATEASEQRFATSRAERQQQLDADRADGRVQPLRRNGRRLGGTALAMLLAMGALGSPSLNSEEP